MLVGDLVQSLLAIQRVRRAVRRLPMGLWREHKTLTRGGGRQRRYLKRPPEMSSIVFLLMAGVQGLAQQLPKGVTPEDLATNNKLFIELAKKALKWEEPAEPFRIVGPIYFVGTKGSAPFCSRRPRATS